jgi:hypothetical protein
MTKFSPWTLFILLFSLVAFSALASAQASDQKAPASAQTVTGCLQKGVEPTGGFFLVTAKSQHLELYDDGTVALGDHVGQQVSMTGTVPKRSAEQEKVSQPYEKQETGKMKHGDFQVSSLKVVSQTCTK